MSKKTRRTFTREFKDEVIKLVTAQGYTLTKAATNLVIGLSAMGKWVKGRKNAGSVEIVFPGKGNLIFADNEIRLLKQELERTRREQDILKSNWAFCQFFTSKAPIYR